MYLNLVRRLYVNKSQRFAAYDRPIFIFENQQQEASFLKWPSSAAYVHHAYAWDRTEILVGATSACRANHRLDEAPTMIRDIFRPC